MAFQLYEIQSEEEFKPIGQLLADGYEQPFNSFWQLLKGETEEERVSRLWQWHQMAPGSHWVAVKDSAGRVVGGSEWVLHEPNPFKNGNPIPTAYWWSDGKRLPPTEYRSFTDLPKNCSRMSPTKHYRTFSVAAQLS